LIQCGEGVSVDFGTINGHIYEIAVYQQLERQ